MMAEFTAPDPSTDLQDLQDLHGGVDCSQALQRLYDYLDSEMTASDIERIRAHVDSCGACFKEYDLEEHLKALIKKSCCEKAPEELRMRIMSQITVIQRSERLDS